MKTDTEPRGTRRQKQKEETRRLILEAAYRLFDERGYDRTTMRDLATHAGVGLGTIFKHYPDKSSLLVAAFADDVARAAEEAFVSMPPANLRAQLLHITRDLYAFYARRPSLSRVLGRELLGLEAEPLGAVHNLWMEFIARIVELHQAAVVKEELRATTDCSTAALSFWSFYVFGLQMGLLAPSFDVDSSVDTVAGLIDQHALGMAGANWGR